MYYLLFNRHGINLTRNSIGWSVLRVETKAQRQELEEALDDMMLKASPNTHSKKATRKEAEYIFGSSFHGMTDSFTSRKKMWLGDDEAEELVKGKFKVWQATYL